MPVETTWYDRERGLIYQQFTGKWTWDEFYPAHTIAESLIREATQRVDFIVDVLAAGRVIPPNTLTHIPRLLTSMENDFANWGLTVFVSQSYLITRFFEVGQRGYPVIARRYRLTSSLDEAVALIEAARLAEHGDTHS